MSLFTAVEGVVKKIEDFFRGLIAAIVGVGSKLKGLLPKKVDAPDPFAEEEAKIEAFREKIAQAPSNSSSAGGVQNKPFVPSPEALSKFKQEYDHAFGSRPIVLPEAKKPEEKK